MSLLQTAYLHSALVPDRVALQEAVTSLGFDLTIGSTYVPFQCSGFCPFRLNGKEAGFELAFEPSASALKDTPHLTEVVGSRDVAVTFRWGGDSVQCACVLIVSAALAQKFGAVIHYQDDDIVYSAEQLVGEAMNVLKRVV